MNHREYHDINRHLMADLEAKNKAVDEFAMQHENLLEDAVYERYWELQDEASKSLGKVLEHQDNYGHKFRRRS